jgi:hypothetical protein
MARIPLRVVHERVAGSRRVITAPSPDDTVVARGHLPDREYLCGACGALLLVGLRRAGLGDAVIKCAACNTLNAAND